jgi:hypothetical protein
MARRPRRARPLPDASRPRCALGHTTRVSVCRSDPQIRHFEREIASSSHRDNCRLTECARNRISDARTPASGSESRGQQTLRRVMWVNRSGAAHADADPNPLPDGRPRLSADISGNVRTPLEKDRGKSGLRGCSGALSSPRSTAKPEIDTSYPGITGGGGPGQGSRGGCGGQAKTCAQSQSAQRRFCGRRSWTIRCFSRRSLMTEKTYQD